MNRSVFLFLAACIPYCLQGQTIHREMSIRDAIAIGLERNPEIQAAHASVIAARGRFWSGIALPNPELSIAHEYIPGGMGLGNSTERTIGVTQSFEFPTNYLFKASILSHGQDVARAGALQASRQMAGRIKNCYFAAWGARRRLTYARDNLALSDSILAKIDLRARVGEAAPLERLTARVQHSEARNDLMTAQNELVMAYADLNNALGFSSPEYDTSVVLTDAPVITPRTLDIDSLVAIIDEQNPQILAARARMAGAIASRSLAWSSLLPNFTISYFKQAKDGVDDYYGASVGASIPLWFMFDTRGKVEESQAGAVIAEAELAAIRNAVLTQLRNAASTLQNNENSVRLYHTDLTPQAEEVYRIASRGYASGDLSYLEYLQAKVTLLATQRNYLTSLLNYMRSVALLEELTGGPDDLR